MTLKTRISDLRASIEQKKGRRDGLLKKNKAHKKDKRNLKKSLINHEKALEIIKEVGQKTQETLQYHISDITSLALDAVFDDPYKLVVKFVERRDKIECDLFFERNGHELDPLDSSGGGTVDVGAFSLRIASWSLQNPRSRNVIVLDEPMRFVSKNLQNRASQMIKELSVKLGIQFIIVTHEEALANEADKVFKVKIKDGVSKVTSYEQNRD